MPILEVDPKVAGEQLSLLSETLQITDDAILDDASIAVAGVRKFVHDQPVMDIEIFQQNPFDPHSGIEVYPLDNQNNPVNIKPVYNSLEDSYLKSAVSAVLVARAQGKV